MKTTFNFFLLFFLGLNLSTATVLAGNQSDTDAEALETFYVEYREDNLDMRTPPYNSMNNELDRYYYLKKNFEKVFEKEEWPVNIEFQRYPVQAPEGAKILHVNFLGFRSLGRVELEMRLYVTVSQAGEKEDLAVTLVRHVPRAFGSPSSIERDLDEIYTKAAKEIVSDLKNTLFKEN